jgi:hypothetical protein
MCLLRCGRIIGSWLNSRFLFFVVGVLFLQGILRFPQGKSVVLTWLLVHFRGRNMAAKCIFSRV